MTDNKLILILGDQLSLHNPALQSARPGQDVILMAEVQEETTYVRHNRHKIALLFSAMRHFRDTLREHGHEVRYYTLDQGLTSLAAAVTAELSRASYTAVSVCEPGEYRLRASMQEWPALFGCEVEILPDYQVSDLNIRLQSLGRFTQATAH